AHLQCGDSTVGRFEQRQAFRSEEQNSSAGEPIGDWVGSFVWLHHKHHGRSGNRWEVEEAGCGIECGTGPTRAALSAGHRDRALKGRRRVKRSVLVSLQYLHGLSAELGCEIDQI